MLTNQQQSLAAEKNKWHQERMTLKNTITEKLSMITSLVNDNKTMNDQLEAVKQEGAALKNECLEHIHQIDSLEKEIFDLRERLKKFEENTTTDRKRILIIGNERASLLSRQYTYISFLNEEDLYQINNDAFDQYDQIFLTSDMCTSLGQVKTARMAGSKYKIFSTCGQLKDYLEGEI
jgi:chromosome segregation ATPase